MLLGILLLPQFFVAGAQAQVSHFVSVDWTGHVNNSQNALYAYVPGDNLSSKDGLTVDNLLSSPITVNIDTNIFGYAPGQGYVNLGHEFHGSFTVPANATNYKIDGIEPDNDVPLSNGYAAYTHDISYIAYDENLNKIGEGSGSNGFNQTIGGGGGQ